MAEEFYRRLREYFVNVGRVLRGEAGAASIFPNTTDIGMSRERVYAEFLRSHLPSSCNVLFGGFVFNLRGEESNQLDLIVTTDSCPRYNMVSPDGSGKSFACMDGTIAVVALKSNLTSPELENALKNVSSLPDKEPLGNRKTPLINIPNYDEWPFKIIYATTGVSLDTLLNSIQKFYDANPSIPWIKRPNLIHVAGRYNIIQTGPEGGELRNGTYIPPNVFYPQVDHTDVYGLLYAVQEIQKMAVSSKHIILTYDQILNNIPFHT